MILGHFTIQVGLTVAAAATGVLFGQLYFAALRRNVASFVDGNGWMRPLALTVGRLGAAVVFLIFVARLGAVPLLGSLTGFLVARARALRAQGRTR
jgi:hypothetical protein